MLSWSPSGILRDSQLDATPHNGHDVSVNDRPETPPYAEASSGYNGKRDMICGTGSTSENHGNGHNECAEDDTNP